MFHASIPDFTAVSLIFFAAGLVKGVLGMGLPTLAMGLLGLVMPVAQAAVLLGVPSLVTNVWQAASGPHLPALLRRLWPLQAGIALGVAGGWRFMDPAHQEAGGLALGACLLVYAGFGLAGWQLPPPRRRLGLKAAAVGGITGLLTAATGVFVLPAVPFLQSLALDKDEMAQALGLCFVTSTVALAVLLAATGALRTAGLLQSTLVLAPALAGMWVGQRIRREIPAPLFRRCFFGGLGVLGAWLVVRPWL